MLLHLALAAALLAAPPQYHPRNAPDTTATAVTNKLEEPATAGHQVSDPVKTSHTVLCDGKEITYQATAGFLPVLSDGGETEASLFHVTYVVEPARKERPLLFFFNGGPGAASVWLHLGAAGPQRVQMLPDGSLPAAPYRLTANESTWLDRADLVFVDPVGTGYSRAAKAEQSQKFFTQQGDTDSLGRFIRLYLTRHKRWNSPIFLVGESYGAFRVAGLSEYLVEHGIALNGIILISSVMNFQTLSFDHGNDLPYVLFLPSYTATAWYHGKLAPALQADLDKTLTAAQSWAETDYLVALGKGDRQTPDERRATVARLAEFTGLAPGFVADKNLRIDRRLFVRELLREQRQVAGFMDSRFSATDVDPSSPHSFDPTVATIRPPYTAMMNHYLRNDLGFSSDLEYFVLGGGIGRWELDAKNAYADTSDNLRNTFAKNPYMQLFVASGLFDLATPHAATEYTLNHLGLPPELRKNITTRRYAAGHMMYLDTGSLARLKRDVAEFIAGALPSKINIRP